MRNVFPLHPVMSKRPESPYGAKYFVFAENHFFQFFGLLIPYRGPIGQVQVGWICFCWEVAYLGDPSETKIQNHSHEIRLERLVCMLLTQYHFACTRYQNIEKPLT